ncbi:MAG: GIY-YIG nuclease family protein [Eubacteriales bacterium]|nr:GIY-YIG nuclease family protein [Eubacteriales bacterium]
MNYTYILKCSDGTLYTGWTTDLDKRLKAHNAKKGAKYTKTRTPVTLAYYESFETKEEAMRREWEIKQLTRKDKLLLCAKEKAPHQAELPNQTD